MVDGSNLPMYIRVIHGEADESVDANGCLEPRRVHQGSPLPEGVEGSPRQPSPDRLHLALRPLPDQSLLLPRQVRRPLLTGPHLADRLRQGLQRAEPFAYSWSGDDRTSVFTCKGSCDYEIVFGVSPGATVVPPI